MVLFSKQNICSLPNAKTEFTSLQIKKDTSILEFNQSLDQKFNKTQFEFNKAFDNEF